MELDLTEYDQVEEIKLLMDKHGHMYCDGSSSKLLVTLSSCSDQTSTDECNLENDFVLLPPPPKANYSQHEENSARSRCDSIASKAHELKLAPAPIGGHEMATNHNNNHTLHHTVAYPLAALNSIGNNPFGNCRQPAEDVLKSIGMSGRTSDPYASKPIGLLEVSSSASGNPSKVCDLMQQIVSRSDSIYIAIPCAYCHELVSCPPSDISGWLCHMNRQHNCKVCPICNKLIGLGPKRDLAVLKRHVIEHLDEDWLERRTIKASFTFGLQQQWFSGSRCGIKDSKSK